MNGRALMVASCTALLLTSCASQPPIKTPLPYGITNPSPPEPNLPAPVAALVGVWAGTWGTYRTTGFMGSSNADLTLIIDRVFPGASDSFVAVLTYSWGESWARKGGYVRTIGVIGQDGVLRLEPFSDGGTITAMLSENQQVLHTEYQVVGGGGSLPIRSRGTLWRTKLP